MPQIERRVENRNSLLAMTASPYPFVDETRGTPDSARTIRLKSNDPDGTVDASLIIDFSFWLLYTDECYFSSDPLFQFRSQRPYLEAAIREKHLQEIERLLDRGQGYLTICRLSSVLRKRIKRSHVHLEELFRQIWQSQKVLDSTNFDFYPVNYWDGDEVMSSLAKFAIAWENMTWAKRNEIILHHLDSCYNSDDITSNGTTPDDRKKNLNTLYLLNLWRRAVALCAVYSESLIREGVIRTVLSHFEVFGNLEALKVPSEEPEEHAYARVIGIRLKELRERGELSDFNGQKNVFYSWAGEQINMEQSTARKAIAEAGCLHIGRRGKPGDGLQETIESLINFVSKAR